MQRTVLIVDDERNMRMVMQMALEEAGYQVLTSESADAAMSILKEPDLDVVLSDLKMPGMSGKEFIARCQQLRPDVPVIIVTAFGSIRSAIECIHAGASDYVTKPFEPEELQFAVQSALRLHDLMQQNRQLQAAVNDSSPRQRLVGNSQVMLELRDKIHRVAPYKTNVLITGESGTGKEAVARSIHEYGPRADKPWVAINCSAIPHELMESELFGYVRGAFTGAVQNRLGRLEQANGGTLFLDEVGDLDLPLQAKLLRVLQEREFSPVGSDVLRRVDLRVIAATHRDLDKMVKQGSFREDLLYRLDVYKIYVPPLRERNDDIDLLTQNFLENLRAEMDKPIERFSNEAIHALCNYDWPGNVRELRNAVERSLLSCNGMVIELNDLPDKVKKSEHPDKPQNNELDQVIQQGLDNWLMDNERKMIIAALKETDGVQVQAAKLLGIAQRSLWHRIKKLAIRVDRTVRE
jgi:two-component system, NtrC family, response regulator AtoC